jgi:NitT/TauT family transport system ATP-binding protein
MWPAGQRVLSKFYAGKRGSTLGLDGFNFNIRPTEVVSIVGPTGCGTSTALNLFAGFEQASAGSVIVDGQTIQ